MYKTSKISMVSPIKENNINKKKRCYFCNKKQLFLHKCICNQVFCLEHRFPDIHNCTCNHKTNCKVNEACIAEKVQKI